MACSRGHLWPSLLGGALLACAGPLLAAPGAWSSGGPYGGKVQALAVDPLTSSTIYAGTVGAGVFKSTDGGSSWTASSAGLPTGLNVSALAVHPATPATVYAGTPDGLFKSTDSGANWVAANNGLTDTDITALAIRPGPPYDVLAGTRSAGAFHSGDGGTTWVPWNGGLGGSPGVGVFATRPGSPTLYASIGGGGAASGLYSGSFNVGYWSGLQSTPGPRSSALVADPTAASVLYVGGNPGLYKSTDGGDSWTAVGAGLPADGVSALAIDPSQPSRLYCGTDGGGLYRSTDAGLSWTAGSGVDDQFVGALAVDPGNGAHVLAGVRARGVLRSTDGAASWTTSAAGIDALTPTALLLDPAESSTVYAGLGNYDANAGVFKSTDSGTTWNLASQGLPVRGGVRTLAAHPGAPGTVYAGCGYDGLYRSTDGGSSWTRSNTGLLSPVYSIEIDPAAASTLFAGGYYGLYKSTDSGATWAPSDTGLRSNHVTKIKAVAALPGTLYAGFSSGGVDKSTDGGATWFAANEGLPFSNDINDLAVDPSTPTTVYAATYVRSGTVPVYKTTDGGGTWLPASSGITGGIAYALAIDPLAPAKLYVGTQQQRVLRSSDAGATWSPANDGLPANRPGWVQALAIEPTGATVFAGLSIAGVWQSTPPTPVELAGFEIE